MDYRELLRDPVETIRAAMDGRQALMWTALPGIIESVNLGALTVEVTPAIKAKVTHPDGTFEDMTISKLLDVPIVFPRGGGYTITFPIKPGDECLVVFSSRCIDNWWQQGGVQAQYERRLHDLSDGFAIVGPFSQATKILNVSDKTVQVRSDDGKLFAEVDQPNSVVRLVTPRTVVTLDDKNYQVTATAGSASVLVDGQNSRVQATAETTTMVVDGPSGKITTTGQSNITFIAPRIDLNP